MPAGGQKQKSRDPLKHVPIVGIGASAGGLEAVTALLKHLPPDTGLGFVLVQHLDPQHESALTQILARATSMPVREITDYLPVEANHVYIIPPNTNLSMTKGVLNLRPRQQGRTPPRSIDFFFESLAQDQGERTIGVILSGTATDGTLGLEAIKAAGGITFAQDASARYDSMPRSAIASGCVDFVLKPQDIAKELARIAKHPYIASQPHESISRAEDRAAVTEREQDKTAPPKAGPRSPRSAARPTRAEDKAASGQDVTDRQRAEAATALLAAIVNSSDDAIIGKDLAGVITSWNKSAESLFGYTAREAIGQPITMLIPPDRQQEEPEILERLKRGESVNHFETVRVTKNGSRLEISLTISPIKDAKGQIIGASKIARDITERKRAEEALRESEERYRTLFDFDPVAVYSCDASGVIQKFNRRAAELWGREPASGDTDERFCGSFKMFRPDGSFMPHEQCPMAEVVAAKYRRCMTRKCSSSGPTARGSPSS